MAEDREDGFGRTYCGECGGLKRRRIVVNDVLCKCALAAATVDGNLGPFSEDEWYAVLSDLWATFAPVSNSRVPNALQRLVATAQSSYEARAALASREQDGLTVKPEHISRVELIDHRRSVDRGGGRQFTAYDVSVELQYQDDGRTLKVFVDNRTALSDLPHDSPNV